MADTKVSALTLVTAVNADDLLPIVQSSTSKSVRVADLAIGGYATTATAAGTTTLTATSPLLQFFTGTTTQTIVLPDATTLHLGHSYWVDNGSTGDLTINKNGGTLLFTVVGNTDCELVLTDNSSAAGAWDVHYYSLDGIVSAESACVLTANYTLTSTTSAQKLFNASSTGALTLPTGTYFFDCILNINTMSATSGNGQFQIQGGGTATVGGCTYQVIGADLATVTVANSMSGSLSITSSSTNPPVSAGTSAALAIRVSGMFRVTTAGTIIPSIALTTAAAAVVQAGSFFRCKRVGNSTMATVGNWS